MPWSAMPERRLRHDASDQNPVSTTAGYAAGGLVLSLTVHLGSLAGFQPPGGNVLIAGLNGGIFLLGLAMIIIAKMLPGTTDVTTDNWRFPVFPGCPPWMNYMARGFYIYALANFARSFLMSLLSTATPTLTMSHSLGAGDPRILERLFEHEDVGLFDWSRNPRDRSPRKQTCQRPQHGRWRAGQRKIGPAKFYLGRADVNARLPSGPPLRIY
jgi:hypothetical protein